MDRQTVFVMASLERGTRRVPDTGQGPNETRPAARMSRMAHCGHGRCLTRCLLSTMRLRHVIGLACLAAALAAGSADGSAQAEARPAGRAAAAKTCPAGFVRAKLSWGEKCLKVGRYCKIKGDREYHRYRFHCHTGRLSRSAAGGNQNGSGCQPGYSACLPRVAGLNCSDIPASKRPVRGTGDDPYRLDGDGDGWGCD
jgi:hypothetical protein